MSVTSTPENARSTPDTPHYTASDLFVALATESVEGMPMSVLMPAATIASDLAHGRLGYLDVLGRPVDGVARDLTYFIRMDCPVGLRPIKIGTSTDLKGRLYALACSSPFPLTLLASYPGLLLPERALHDTLAKDRMQGEWFRPTGRLLELVELVQSLPRTRKRRISR